jgi:hypothetical protein
VSGCAAHAICRVAGTLFGGIRPPRSGPSVHIFDALSSALQGDNSIVLGNCSMHGSDNDDAVQRHFSGLRNLALWRTAVAMQAAAPPLEAEAVRVETSR